MNPTKRVASPSSEEDSSRGNNKQRKLSAEASVDDASASLIPLLLETIVLPFVLSEGYVYRGDSLGIPRTCRVWNELYKATSFPLCATVRIDLENSWRHRQTEPDWLTQEKKAIITSPAFLKQVYEKILMYRVNAIQCKKERLAAQASLLDFAYIYKARVTVYQGKENPTEWYDHAMMEITFFYKRDPLNAKLGEFYCNSNASWMARLLPDFTTVSIFSKGPQRLYEEHGSPPLWP